VSLQEGRRVRKDGGREGKGGGEEREREKREAEEHQREWAHKQARRQDTKRRSLSCKSNNFLIHPSERADI